MHSVTSLGVVVSHSFIQAYLCCMVCRSARLFDFNSSYSPLTLTLFQAVHPSGEGSATRASYLIDGLQREANVQSSQRLRAAFLPALIVDPDHALCDNHACRGYKYP